MENRFSKKKILTVPNAMSLFRILLIPLIYWFYVTAERPYLAVGLVALSGLTDIGDGFIARRFHMVSDVGKVLDPIADKLTQAGLLICLMSRYHVILWVFILLCLKEILQGVLGYLTLRTTGQIYSARWYGKVSTGVFYAVMIALLLFPGMPETWAYVLIGLCAAAFLMAMVLYTHYFLDRIWARVYPNRSRKSVLVKIFVIVLWLCVIVFCLMHRDNVTVDGILRISPRSTVLAILLMLGLFALKSLSVVIYSGIFYAASGILFPLPLAIAVNICGTAVMTSIPYAAGRKLGGEMMGKITLKYPGIAMLEHMQTDNTFLFSFVIRVLNLLSYDVISAYFGASGSAFVPFLLGSIAGMLPPCVLYPILGMNITNIRSPQFIIAAGVQLAIMAVGIGAVLVVRKRVITGGEHTREKNNKGLS